MKYQELSPWALNYGTAPTLEVRELRRQSRQKRFLLMAVDATLYCSLAAITAYSIGLVAL